MAFYTRKNGLDHFRLARTRKACNCFICGDFIPKGQYRYATQQNSLCLKCASCWEKEGGVLGGISRAVEIKKMI